MRVARFAAVFMMSVAFFLVGLVGSCADDKGANWDCHRVNVPGGQAVECVGQNAVPLTTDYNCINIDYNPLAPCPPTSGTTTDGTGAYGPADKTMINSGGSVTGVAGPSGSPTPYLPLPDCFFGPDLQYCAPGSYGGPSPGPVDSPLPGTETFPTDGGAGTVPGGAGSDAGTTGNGGAPGNGNGGNHGNGVGNPHGSGSGGNNSGGSNTNQPGFNCSCNGSTTVVCQKPPVCGTGMQPAACGVCVSNTSGPAQNCMSPKEGGCWFTGGGFIIDSDGKDTYGGNGKPMKDGSIQGEWNHVDHGTMDHAHGKVEYLVCRVAAGPGPGQPGGKKGLVANQVYFGGHARWRSNDVWNDGYWFDVVAEDHGEPGNVKSNGLTEKGTMPDWYHFTIRKQSDPVLGMSGAVVYETEGPFMGGNFQIHPSNGGHPASTSTLPPWVKIEH